MNGGRIYFIRRADGEGPIKIGCSSYPEGRRKQIGYDMRLDLTLLAFAPGGLEVERSLHRRFASHRVEVTDLPERPWPIGGIKEWFEPVPELLALIETVNATGALPPIPASDRDASILRRRTAGETLQSIANDVGLTRERVRQIASEMKRRIARKAAA